MKLKILASTFLLATAWALPAAADTSLELLYGWGFNEDFNGDSERVVMSIKTFQPWPYGTFFMYYDITGPFTAPDSHVLPNEKGGFFGGTSVTVSVKQVGQKIAGEQWDWGALLDFSLRYELEHVSKFGALHYYGLQADLKLPYFDFFSTTAVIRDDFSLSGVAVQVGGAWQITVPIAEVTDVVFAGFWQWGLFGEGEGTFALGPDATGAYLDIPTEGRAFFITQPQLLVDVGKLSTLVNGKFYAGVEGQIAFNRYLQDRVHEHLVQLMLKWNI